MRVRFKRHKRTARQNVGIECADARALEGQHGRLRATTCGTEAPEDIRSCAVVLVLTGGLRRFVELVEEISNTPRDRLAQTVLGNHVVQTGRARATCAGGCLGGGGTLCMGLP